MSSSDSDWIQTHFNIVTFCPEVAAGLPIPRPSAEINIGTGADVLIGKAKVIDLEGSDASQAFLHGAKLALAMCLSENIRYALLTEASPSCGSALIYDGSFNGIKKVGEGVTAALLRQNGIRVFSPNTIDLLKQLVSE
ncbi:DUF523 domain-containing protein [Vibrio sp. DNF-1]|nr:DUF523 domain-containing protein [Vibrio salinus]